VRPGLPLVAARFRAKNFHIVWQPSHFNRTLLLGIGVEVLLLLLLIYEPVFADTFGLTGLQWQHGCLLVAFGPVLLVLEEVRKIVSRKYWP
jgi:hypothetical protein